MCLTAFCREIFHNVGFSLPSPHYCPHVKQRVYFIRRVDSEVQRETKKIVCCPELAVAAICQISCSAHQKSNVR